MENNILNTYIKSYKHKSFISINYPEWSGELCGNQDNKKIAHLDFSKTKSGCHLNVKFNTYTVLVETLVGDFITGSGNIYLDDILIAKYLSKGIGNVVISFPVNSQKITLQRDSYERRLKWAFRQSFSLRESIKYAKDTPFIIKGDGFILASLQNPTYVCDKINLLNDRDKNITSNLTLETQIALLYILLRPFCGLAKPATVIHYFIKKSSHFPNVPSFTETENNGIKLLSINPNDIKNYKRNIFLEFLTIHTNPLIDWMFIGIFIFIYLSFNTGEYNLGIRFLLYGGGSLLLLKWVIKDKTKIQTRFPNKQ